MYFPQHDTSCTSIFKGNLNTICVTHLLGQRSDYKDGRDTNSSLIKILNVSFSPERTSIASVSFILLAPMNVSFFYYFYPLTGGTWSQNLGNKNTEQALCPKKAEFQSLDNFLVCLFSVLWCEAITDHENVKLHNTVLFCNLWGN